MIVDIRMQAIADSKQEAQPVKEFALLGINRAEMQRALESGTTAPTPYYEVQGKPYKYSYTPLMDELTGEAFGFLRLEASPENFEQMRQLRSRLIVLSGITAALLGFVALIFHRLLRYVLGAQKAAAQADRLQSVATLAAGFAHEVRNPLGIIRSSAEGLADELAEKGDAGAIALSRDMVEEVDRLNQLITQFLDFASPTGESAWQPVNVAETLLGVLSLARKDLEAKRIDVRRDFDDSAPPIQANGKSLKQVFLNVLLNAKDATDPGGSITLSTRVRRGRLTVAFEDTGHGIAEADLKSVFDPFFTTKPSGTGLGLSISRNIIRQFNGDMEIKSQKEHGTTVEIRFPI
jgi:signal transduction histidine kinase